MNAVVYLGALVAVPLLLALALRVSSVYLFASVAAGGMLSRYLSDDASFVIKTLVKKQDPTMIMQIGLLLVPVVLTLFLLRKTLQPARIVLEFLPLLASVGMLVVILLPLLPATFSNQISATPYGKILHNSQDVVIGVAILLNLSLLWLMHRAKSAEGHRKHH